MTIIERDVLSVNLIGIDYRNRNAIEMVFNKNSSVRCRFTNKYDGNNANLSIVDLDKYGAADQWAALQQIKPEQLAIFLSSNKLLFSQVEGQIGLDKDELFLQKPFTIVEFESTLAAARDRLKKFTFSASQGREDWYHFLSKRVPQVTSMQSTKSTEKMQQPDLIDQQDTRYITEHGYLIDLVKQLVLEANNDGYGIRIDLDHQGSIFIDPSEYWISTDLNNTVLKKISCLSLVDVEVQKHIFTDYEFSECLSEWRSSRLKPIDIDAFLWDLALWTYRGNLPQGTDREQKVILKHWPDLTRLRPINNAMRIASLWLSYPKSIKETSETLQIPVTDVHNFYVAADTIGLIQKSNVLTKRPKPGRFFKPHTRTDVEQHRFYLRIIEHIKRQALDG